MGEGETQQVQRGRCPKKPQDRLFIYEIKPHLTFEASSAARPLGEILLLLMACPPPIKLAPAGWASIELGQSFLRWLIFMQSLILC